MEGTNQETFSEINFKTTEAHKQAINFGRKRGGKWCELVNKAEGDGYQDSVMINLQT
jgi:hypothetical protein